MKSITVSISDNDFEKFGLKSRDYSFAELIKILDRALTENRLDKSLELAEKYGLSTMSLDEIDQEIASLRKNAKGSH